MASQVRVIRQGPNLKGENTMSRLTTTLAEDTASATGAPMRDF